MRNSQLAVLGIIILVAAGMVIGANAMLVSSIHDALPRTTSGRPGGGTVVPPARPVTIGFMPKSKSNPYFIAARRGAVEAATELNCELIWNGPATPDPARQNEVVESWIARGVDVIAVAVEDPAGIAPVLKKARDKGITVITWDSDTEPDARDFFVNQATAQGIGDTLMDDAAQVMGGKGDFAVITGSLTASNMNEWRKFIEKRRADKYPDMHLITTEPCDDKQQVATDKANAIMHANPNVKLLMAICAPAVPGAAEAVKQSGRTDVKVVGLGLPNDNKTYVDADITPNLVLWNIVDLGYLTVHAAYDAKMGTLTPGMKELQAGRIGAVKIAGDNIILGNPFRFTKNNIDQYDF